MSDIPFCKLFFKSSQKEMGCARIRFGWTNPSLRAVIPQPDRPFWAVLNPSFNQASEALFLSADSYRRRQSGFLGFRQSPPEGLWRSRSAPAALRRGRRHLRLLLRRIWLGGLLGLWALHPHRGAADAKRRYAARPLEVLGIPELPRRRHMLLHLSPPERWLVGRTLTLPL